MAPCKAIFGACAAVSLLVPSRLPAQEEVVIQGWVVDAVSVQLLRGIRVTAGDSSASVVTGTDGTFRLRLPRGSPLVVYAEGMGYVSETFDLPPESVTRRAVLRLQPEPLAIEGLTAVAESALEGLQRSSTLRRQGYGEGSVRAFDQARLRRFAPVGGSVLDLVLERLPRIRACRNDPSQMCFPARGPTPQHPDPESSILVCIDGWRSLGPFDELHGLPVEGVALVELIGNERINAYTAGWMLNMARQGRTSVMPLWVGC
jgi:hypothetical protein